jgi:hypothetical protein
MKNNQSTPFFMAKLKNCQLIISNIGNEKINRIALLNERIISKI